MSHGSPCLDDDDLAHVHLTSERDADAKKREPVVHLPRKKLRRAYKVLDHRDDLVDQRGHRPALDVTVEG